MIDTITNLIQKKVFITNPKDEHFALKNAEGVVTSANMETQRLMIKVKQPDGTKTFLWFDLNEISETLEETKNEKIVPEAVDIDPVVFKEPKITPVIQKKDPVNHPSHYTDGQYEVIDFIEACNLDQDFRIANAVKYICRAGKKEGSDVNQDMKKALWYLTRYCESTGSETFSPRASRNLENKVIDICAFVEDKQLAKTAPGFALEAIYYGCIALAKDIMEAYLEK